MRRSKDCGTIAVWESSTKQIFCDLCLKEVEAGNRPTTFFNKEGWQNITQNFKERTGRDYNKLQLKNKWDQLKKDWKMWKELKRGSTGLGWDPKNKTIDASDDWWREKLEVMPNAKKFRYGGIEPELEEKLDVMFGGVVATSYNAWEPYQDGTNVLQDPEECEEIEHSNDLNEDVSPTMFTTTQSSGNKRSAPSASSGSICKKGSAGYIREQISGLLTVCTKLFSDELSSPKPPTLSESIKVLESIPEVYNDVPLFLFSTSLLEDSNKREIFMTISTERRVPFLCHHFERSSTRSSSSMR